jgi:hypothetical protein
VIASKVNATITVVLYKLCCYRNSNLIIKKFANYPAYTTCKRSRGKLAAEIGQKIE